MTKTQRLRFPVAQHSAQDRRPCSRSLQADGAIDVERTYALTNTKYPSQNQWEIHVSFQVLGLWL